MKETIDQDLVLRIRNSDYIAFEEFHKRFYDSLYRLAIRKIGNAEETYDLLQDMFIEIWEKREEFEMNNALEAYMRNRLWFKIGSYFRKKGFQDKHIQKFTEFLQSQEHQQFNEQEVQEIQHQYDLIMERIAEVIETMPEKMKAVFILSKEEQLSVQAIADKLDISPKTVKNHLHAAMKKMKLEMAEYSPGMLEMLVLIWLINS
ncbi:RNA polymerase sigma factor [Sphingobacterium lactis]|uniref:RNA polymerase sigma-70 factor, ECF subfamily n=1 Tax=Sphingobacterium lactis TaxID=797291 RepID=A0A1H5YV72_9SPHI|nr:sigma-70 family RNA polymerase sigma factor [Sphingobacterium lactis]SEG27335.1 RNA polymerase sigma-70 factor, ECF subfamily [Sphingobacterium lactis]